MDRKRILVKITSITLSLLILISLIMPVVVNAARVTDSVQKIVLKTVEDIEKIIPANLILNLEVM